MIFFSSSVASFSFKLVENWVWCYTRDNKLQSHDSHTMPLNVTLTSASSVDTNLADSSFYLQFFDFDR